MLTANNICTAQFVWVFFLLIVVSDLFASLVYDIKLIEINK